MRRVLFLVFTFLTAMGVAQDVTAQQKPEPQVSISKLAPPIYPNLARLARVSGSVKLQLSIRPDGAVESVSVISGHPMLNPVALESARQTQYECGNCSDSTSYVMTYNFELGETVYCEGIDAAGGPIYSQSSFLKVTQVKNLITVSDRPTGTCDPSASITGIKVRSSKCLYLWHCGLRYPL